MSQNLYTRSPSPNSSSSSLVGDEGQSTIFRKRAVKHYLEGREGEVLPRFISPKSFYLLWVVFVALVGSVAASAYFAQIPVYASGPAVVVETHDSGSPSVAAFLPAEYLQELKKGKGQDILLRLDREGARESLQVDSIVPEAMSPREAGDRFNLSDAQKGAVRGPAAVAVAPLKGSRQGLDDSSYSSGVYRVEAEVGSKRAISLVPVVGGWFGEGAR